MKRTSVDEFAKCRDNFRGYQSGRIHNVSTEIQYPSDFLEDVYNKWSKLCAKKYAEYKNKNDLKGFKDWFEQTKFTSERLKNEWNNYSTTEQD